MNSRKSIPASKARRPRATQTLGELFARFPAAGVTASVVGERIITARKRRSLNQSDLSRATKLSRTVINGYEKGRHLPGSRELALICDALKTSPNELLYGVADPFAGQSGELKTNVAVSAAIMLHAIEQNERDAILTLLLSLVEFRHGRQAAELLKEVGPAALDQVRSSGVDLERLLEDQPAVPSMKAYAERLAASEKGHTAIAPRTRRTRRSAKRSR